MNSSKIALCCSAAIAALTWTAPAVAQQDAAAAATTTETVVVTANRRSESAQNVGGGLTALSNADLEQMHANSFTDFAATVPSLSYFAGGPTTDQIVLRGVTAGSVQKGNTVGVYIDDVPMGSSTQFGIGSAAPNFDLFDMQRVEILDGPQGTLYGANSMGGAVKYVTAKPQLSTYDALAEAEGSNTAHGGFNDDLRVMANLPLFGDMAALRLDGVQEYDTGYAHDPNYGPSHVGSERTFSGRVSFFAQLTADLDVRLTALTQHNYANGYDAALYNFTTGKPVHGDYNQSYQVLQPSEKNLDVYSAEENWNLHWATLTSVTSYQSNETKSDADVSPLYNFILALYGTNTYLPPYTLPFNYETQSAIPLSLPTELLTKKFTQEVRLASPNNKNLEWVLGGFYTREITDESIFLIDPQTANGQLPFPYNFADTNAPNQPALPFYGELPSSYKELAVYGDATYYFTDDLDLTLGIRYSTQHQNFQAYLQSFILPAAYDTIAHFPYSCAAGCVYQTNQSAETYLINPRYRITENTMLYVKVSSGYEPGGPNFVLPIPTAVGPTFRSASLWNYEVGEKSTLLDGKATFDFDIYDIEWDGIQTTANVDGINQLINAGDARIEGAESSFSYRPIDSLTLNGSGSYTNAFLTKNTLFEQEFMGVYGNDQRLPLSPRWSFALSGTYTTDLGGGFTGAVNLTDQFVGSRSSAFNVGVIGQETISGAPNFKLPSYNTVNANLSLFMPHNMQLDVYVKNIFDTRGEVSANPYQSQYMNPYFAVPNAYPAVPVQLSLPRTVGVVLRVGLD